jgi:hypothetical protein
MQQGKGRGSNHPTILHNQAHDAGCRKYTAVSQLKAPFRVEPSRHLAKDDRLPSDKHACKQELYQKSTSHPSLSRSYKAQAHLT